MNATKKQMLRRRVIAAAGTSVDWQMGMPGWRRQLRRSRRFALPAQKWPGHRRVFLEGAVLRPASYRSALRG